MLVLVGGHEIAADVTVEERLGEEEDAEDEEDAGDDGWDVASPAPVQAGCDVTSNEATDKGAACKENCIDGLDLGLARVP